VDTAYYRGGGLAQNESVTLRGHLDTTDLPASTYNLRVVVDPDRRLADNDRMNNEMVIPFRISEPPARLAELHPTEIEVSPPSPLLRDEEDALPDGRHEMAITARIRNAGSIDSGRFQVEFASRYRASSDAPWGPFCADCTTADCVDPIFCVRQDVVNLERGLSKVVQRTCDITDWPVGLYEIRVRVDPPGANSPRGEVAEQDEDNNTMIIGFRVGSTEAEIIPTTPYPNLVFETLRIAPTQDLDARERVTVEEAVVRNAGEEEAGAFDVSLCWQGRDGLCVPAGAAVPVESLAGESEVDLASRFGTIAAPATPGSYQLVGIADASEQIDERGRESDNRASAFAQVTGMVKPDLTIERIWFSAEPPFEAGTPVTAFARVRNLS
jgi:hypothetical protein